MTSSITLVSGTYNRIVLLQKMVASARAARPASIPLDFVLVDGGSTDGTQAWCKAQSDITLIEHGELLGAVRAFTDGAKVARGKYVVLANDDVSFFPNSLLYALVHLENRPECGAVAFKDNRPHDYKTTAQYTTLRMPAVQNSRRIMVIYAQVGMFRRWLGEHVGWWGADDSLFGARTYGADNYLSSKLWELGYSVEEVNGCQVQDEVAEDELRRINREIGGERDSRAYYDYPAWVDAQGKHTGPAIPDKPQLPQQDNRDLRILYLPIFEQGNDEGARNQHEQKRGLREALAKVGWLYELDYLAIPQRDLHNRLLEIVSGFKPDLMVTQLHGPNWITPSLLQQVRSWRPSMIVVNWNGDTHRANLINPDMLALLRHVDLQLCVNVSVIDVYKQHNIPAAYWQIAFEPVDEDNLPKVPKHDVIFVGTAYNDNRKLLGRRLRERFNGRLGLYGDYWPDGQGRTLYDFRTTCALHKGAKIAVGSNEFPDDYGFVSNRIFETLAAGGALFLMQHVPGLTELTGITPGKHYIEWRDLDDLFGKLDYYLDPAKESERRRIVKRAYKYVHEEHSFDARVTQLFDKLLPLAKRRFSDHTALRYTGMQQTQFGVVGTATGTHYLCEPDEVLYVDSRDAEALVSMGLWERAKVGYGA